MQKASNWLSLVLGALYQCSYNDKIIWFEVNKSVCKQHVMCTTRAMTFVLLKRVYEWSRKKARKLHQYKPSWVIELIPVHNAAHCRVRRVSQAIIRAHVYGGVTIRLEDRLWWCSMYTMLALLLWGQECMEPDHLSNPPTLDFNKHIHPNHFKWS